MSNPNRGGRVHRPYRKASEYLVHSQKPVATPSAQKSNLEQENESLRQKVILLTRKLDHAEAEYLQSREYLESQIDIVQNKFIKVSGQYKKLQSSYVLLQSTNRELENKVSKINRLEDDRSSMTTEINVLTKKLTELRNALLKSQEENERLRKDCNLAVQLLKCNQSSYQMKNVEQVPEELQERVTDYKMKLQDYNEYINPYADNDSDSDGEVPNLNCRHPPSVDVQQAGNGVSADYLAKVLQKPENVHMNLEASDYVRDPQLTSTYKARYTERKLIKPNYDDSPSHNDKKQESSSPWEMNTQSSSESSPWELRTIPPSSSMDQVEDEPSAGAYGAYAVGKRSRPPPQHPKITKHIPPPPVQDAVTPPSSPEELEFRRPAPPDAYIASNFFSKQLVTSVSSSSVSSSKSGSRKGSPVKVRGKEHASKAETSSLLNEEDDNEHDPPFKGSPAKTYLTSGDVEGGTSLLAEVEDSYGGENPPQGQGVNLEWDSTNDLDPEVEIPVEEVEKMKIDPEAEKQENLLLSYGEVEKVQERASSYIQDLLSVEIDPRDVKHQEDDISPGQLLSEIVNSNPSLENFLLTTTPPPPHEFASTPSSGSAPLVDGAPSSGSAPLIDGAPSSGSAPLVDGAPSSGSAPLIDGAPSSGGAPLVDGAPSSGSALLIDGAPSSGSAPLIDGAPSSGGAPLIDGAPYGGSSLSDGAQISYGVPPSCGVPQSNVAPPSDGTPLSDVVPPSVDILEPRRVDEEVLIIDEDHQDLESKHRTSFEEVMD